MDNEIAKEITAKSRQAMAQFINDLPEIMRKNLTNIAKQAIGFRASNWDKVWEIDHCNGRISDISKIITNKAKENLGKIVEEEIADPEFVETVREEVRKEARSAIKKIAVEEARTAIDRITRGYTSEIENEIRHLVAKRFDGVVEAITCFSGLENPEGDELDDAIAEYIVSETLKETEDASNS